MPKKAKLIVNPVAGIDAASDHLPLISRRLREVFDSVDIAITSNAGDATALAHAAVGDGYQHVFAVGGDGTLNEVLNGVATVDGGLGAVALGVIPLGTGNDFATALGIPDALEEALDAIVTGSPRSVDLGRLNDHYFVNVSAGGFLAEVSDAVTPRMKTLTGRLAYLIGGAQVLLDYESMMVRLSSDTVTRSVPLHAFAICNSPLIGGGRLIAPDAVVDDGWFDVCLIGAMPTLEFVGLLRQVSDGRHVHDERVAYFRARELRLEFERMIKVNTDGQVLETKECQYQLLPGAVRFWMRADPRDSAITDENPTAGTNYLPPPQRSRP